MAQEEQKEIQKQAPTNLDHKIEDGYQSDEEAKELEKEEEKARAEELAQLPASNKKQRGTESFTPSDPQSNMIIMWGSPRGDNSTVDETLLEHFATELAFIYDRTNLSVTFPDLLVDMLVESSERWELKPSNLLQKCQIFFDYNVATTR